jgi:hypothetical protein
VDRREFIAAAGSVVVVASESQASVWLMRGAVLDHAVPGVGLTVSGPVREVRLYFTIGAIAASSSVQIISSKEGCECGEPAGQRSFRSAGCDRQAQTRASTRHL